MRKRQYKKILKRTEYEDGVSYWDFIRGIEKMFFDFVKMLKHEREKLCKKQ